MIPAYIPDAYDEQAYRDDINLERAYAATSVWRKLFYVLARLSVIAVNCAALGLLVFIIKLKLEGVIP